MARIERLRSIPLFAGLDDQTLEAIADLGTEATVAPGHILVEKGLGGSGLFIIERGRVAVELPGGPIERGPGEFVGELSILAESPRTARVRALDEVEFVAISREGFQRLLEERPEIAVVMLKGLARRLVEMAEARR